MEQHIIDFLNQPEPGEYHDRLLKHVKDLVDMSRTEMAKKYEEWDRHDDVYRGIRTPDKEDVQARDRKEPEKFVVPITHAQIQTFVAFCFAVFFQRERFFELFSFGDGGQRGAEVGSALLQRDLDYNNIKTKAYQTFLDAGRFGICVLKEYWMEETQWVYETIPAQPPRQFLGVNVPLTGKPPIRKKTRKAKWQGNKLMNVSPYKFFPDTRLPLTRFQEGEFVGSEDEYSYTTLKEMEADGLLAGVDHVPTMSKDIVSKSRMLSRLSFEIPSTRSAARIGESTNNTNTITTEVIVKLIPSKFEIDDKGTLLGEEQHPVKYLVWYCNDQRIVRLEPYTYVHDQFSYSVAELSPDMHHLVNDGLASTIECIQDVLSWFVNSHITSVRKVIQNQLVVDPQGVEMDDLKQRPPVIRLKPGFCRQGTERWVHQLKVTDVTGSHMDDATRLQALIQVVTGISDNALGQFHTGRRSATEAKNVNAATASRLKMIASLLYENCFAPTGRRMLSNLREGLTLSSYVRLFGLQKDPTLQTYVEFAKVNKEDLVGDYDFEIFDGTLPSEKQYIRQTLEEAMQALMAQPELALMLGFDLRGIFLEIMELGGVRNPERFRLPEIQQQMLLQQQMMQQQLEAQNGQANRNGSVSGSSSTATARQT